MTDMRKLINIAGKAVLKESSKEPYTRFQRDDAEMEHFSNRQAMTISQVDKRFGDVRAWKDIFKNGAGVYMAFVGSRGGLEEIEFVGTGPGFDYDTYGGDDEGGGFDDEDEEGYDDEGGGFDDEFTGTYWDDNVFEVGRNEEESDVYFYWSGK